MDDFISTVKMSDVYEELRTIGELKEEIILLTREMIEAQELRDQMFAQCSRLRNRLAQLESEVSEMEIQKALAQEQLKDFNFQVEMKKAYEPWMKCSIDDFHRNLEFVNPQELPFVGVADKYQLPAIGGVYFLMNTSTVLYVGQAKHLKNRWQNHHAMRLALEHNSIDSLRISWIGIPTSPQRDYAETFFIEKFDPMLNIVKSKLSDFA